MLKIPFGESNAPLPPGATTSTCLPTSENDDRCKPLVTAPTPSTPGNAAGYCTGL